MAVENSLPTERVEKNVHFKTDTAAWRQKSSHFGCLLLDFTSLITHEAGKKGFSSLERNNAKQ
jgi:hypothetical protein